MTKHTALPLALKEHSSGYDLIDKDGKFIMSLTGFRYPSPKQLDKFITIAHLIVTACNCHAELLEPLIMLVADYEEMGGADIYPDALKQAKQAIRKAEEQIS